MVELARDFLPEPDDGALFRQRLLARTALARQELTAVSDYPALSWQPSTWRILGQTDLGRALVHGVTGGVATILLVLMASRIFLNTQDLTGRAWAQLVIPVGGFW
jgi:putative copper export protein